MALLAVAGICGHGSFMAGTGGKAVAGRPPAMMPAASRCSTSRPLARRFASYLADGLTEGLIGQLSPGAVNSRSSRGTASHRIGTATCPRDSIARALKVGTLVEGSVEQEKDRVRVTVRLVDAASGAEFQRASFEQPATQYLALGDSLAQKAAVFLRERLGAEVRLREQRQRASNPQAWILVQRAEALSRQADSLSHTDPKAAAARVPAGGFAAGAGVDARSQLDRAAGAARHDHARSRCDS